MVEERKGENTLMAVVPVAGLSHGLMISDFSLPVPRCYGTICSVFEMHSCKCVKYMATKNTGHKTFLWQWTAETKG